MTRRYFEEEMRYLQEAGREFAEAHPEVARYLNIDSVADRDPYVERLFEGFAFLSGRVHERLDDELPQYTESLGELLFPHFLRPIPSLTIVELKPRPGLIQQTTVLDRGLEVRSKPVGDERTVCRFSTTSDVRLHPFRIGDAKMQWRTDGGSTLKIRFDLDRGVQFEKLELSPLRLYFHADAAAAAQLHLYCTRHLNRVALSYEGGDSPLVLQGQQWVTPGGLSDDEGLMPYGPNSFMGHRLMHEYMSFRRKFWFVDIHGLNRLSPDVNPSSFSVELVFDRPYRDDHSFSADQLRLFCAPAVNLFSMDAEPIRLDATVVEHRIKPSVRFRKSIETYDVQSVEGLEENTGRRHVYTPFYQFGGSSGRRSGSVGTRSYTLRRRSGPHGGPDVYLSVSEDGSGPMPGSTPETLSVELRCTNANVPRERVREGMIDVLAPDAPQVVQVRNLTPPTQILRSPTQKHRDFFWKVVSHWSLNYVTVASRESLAGLLDLYDWTETNANQHRIAGLRDVRWAPKEHIYRGTVMRGGEVTISIDEGHFSDEGDLNLFGTILSNFFAMYATINSFTTVAIEIAPSGKRYEWASKQGVQPIL